MRILQIEKVNKSFGGNHIIQDLAIELKVGKVYILLGSNGSGKSTLLNLINGQLDSDTGRIKFFGKLISKIPVYKRATKGILRLWQHGKVFLNMTVLDNLLVSRPKLGENLINYLFKFPRIREEEIEDYQKAMEVLKELDLLEKLKNTGKELSYGQQRLLAFGRVLMHRDLEKGKLLILVDEPFAGIHVSLIKKIASILRSLADQGNTILMIEHNVQEAINFADEIIVLKEGTIDLQLSAKGLTQEALKNIYTKI